MALATRNYLPRVSPDKPGRALLCPPLLCAALLLSATLGLCAQTNQIPAGMTNGAAGSAAAQRAFRDAQAQYNNEPGNITLSWQFARACFDLAEYASNSAERARLAERGIAASRLALERDSNSPPAHYYLGMNLGQLARTKGLGALKLVSMMEHEFIVARDLDEHFDYAGPDRNLGLLYRDAPAIGSVGSRSNARQHLQRAVDLSPLYPENRLSLIEAFLKWSDRKGASREVKALEETWPKARAQFAGAEWASSWPDWEMRLDRARKRSEEQPKTLESPRGKT